MSDENEINADDIWGDNDFDDDDFDAFDDSDTSSDFDDSSDSVEEPTYSSNDLIDLDDSDPFGSDTGLDLSDGDASEDLFADDIADVGKKKKSSKTGEGVKTSYKTAGIILGVAFILLALFLSMVSKVHVNKKGSSNTQQVEGNANYSDESDAQQEEVVDDSNTFKEVPSDTEINYGGQVYTKDGVVSGKSMYLRDNQLVYCIDIDCSLGGSVTEVHYHCGYQMYDSVKKGDALQVHYQQVSDTCYSVVSLDRK